MEEQTFTTISIPKVLAEKIKKKIEGTSFHSVSNYTTYVLRQIVAVSESKNKETEGKVKKQLKIMGYI